LQYSKVGKLFIPNKKIALMKRRTATTGDAVMLFLKTVFKLEALELCTLCGTNKAISDKDKEGRGKLDDDGVEALIGNILNKTFEDSFHNN